MTRATTPAGVRPWCRSNRITFTPATRAEQVRRALTMRLRRALLGNARLSQLLAKSKQMRLRNEDLPAT